MNKIEEIVVPSDKCYLREVMDVLPSHVLLNKGMTGCGGTTLELESPRNSIILVPTINLVENKSMNNDKVFGLYGLVKDNELLRYLYDSTIKYKKIIATYDSLLKLLGLEIVIPNIRDYFLLVDEYHTLFVYYKFRYGAMRYLLSAYKEFKDWCFMSATPLNEYNVLEELKGIDIINMRWEDKARLDIKYSPTESALVLLQQRIYECLQSDYNLHIFFNSFRSIRKVIEKVEEQVGILDYRVVCSYSRADRGVLRCKDINSDVCKINFYTATAHDGCDIFDENGKTIIVSDDTIISTMMDISIHIIQIAGRLRNSKYINQIEWIYSSRKHRYLMKSEDEWEEFVKDNERSGREVLSIYEKTDSTVHVEKGKKVVKGEEKIIEKKYCEKIGAINIAPLSTKACAVAAAIVYMYNPQSSLRIIYPPTKKYYTRQAVGIGKSYVYTLELPQYS